MFVNEPELATVKYLLLGLKRVLVKLEVTLLHEPESVTLDQKVLTPSGTVTVTPSFWSVSGDIFSANLFDSAIVVWYNDIEVISPPTVFAYNLTLFDIYINSYPSQLKQSKDVLLPISPFITESVLK